MKYNDVHQDRVSPANSGFEKGSYAFPLIDQDRYASKLQFTAIQMNSPTFSSKLSAAETIDKASQGKLELNDLKGGTPATLTLLDKVDLYMPQALQMTDTFQYNTPELGASGAAGLGALNAGQGMIGAGQQMVEQGLAGLSDIVGAIGGGNIGALGALRIAQLVPGDKVANVTSLATQTALNPNIRAMFRSVGLREFSFTFKMISMSPEEAEMVKTIVAFFRYNAYPKPIAGFVGYEYPHMFRIKSYVKVNGAFQVNKAVRIKDCYCRNIQVVYNPTQNTFHPDGEPTEVDLTLSFVEHKTLDRNDIEYPTAKVEILQEGGNKFTPVTATEDDVRSPF